MEIAAIRMVGWNCQGPEPSQPVQPEPTLRETIDGATDENMHVWCKVSDVRAALADAQRYRLVLAKVTAVAITMLYDSHKGDTLKAFSINELITVSEMSSGLGEEQVETVYRLGFDAAIKATS